MKTTNNKVLITGGSAGIGLEMAKLFAQHGNKVIVTGRNKERIDKAIANIPGAIGIVSDVSNENDVKQLVGLLKNEHPDLNIIINNAGKAYAYRLSAAANAAAKAAEEMQTNYLSVINITEQLLPLLGSHNSAAVVNVSSIAAYVPGQSIPTYAASKAALHSYTQSLRFALKDTTIRVFELMPPLVNTDFSQEIGGSAGIHPAVVAEDLLKAMANDNYQVHVGQTEALYQLTRKAPEEAFLAMNQTV